MAKKKTAVQIVVGTLTTDPSTDNAVDTTCSALSQNGNPVEFSLDEAGKFLVAVGKTMSTMEVPLSAITGEITKHLWEELVRRMKKQGIKGKRINIVYEQGCGHMFNRWP